MEAHRDCREEGVHSGVLGAQKKEPLRLPWGHCTQEQGKSRDLKGLKMSWHSAGGALQEEAALSARKELCGQRRERAWPGQAAQCGRSLRSKGVTDWGSSPGGRERSPQV